MTITVTLNRLCSRLSSLILLEVYYDKRFSTRRRQLFYKVKMFNEKYSGRFHIECDDYKIFRHEIEKTVMYELACRETALTSSDGKTMTRFGFQNDNSIDVFKQLFH